MTTKQKEKKSTIEPEKEEKMYLNISFVSDIFFSIISASIIKMFVKTSHK